MAPSVTRRYPHERLPVLRLPLCEYACVMGLQPWKLNGMLKGEMGKKGVRNALHNQPEAAAPFRQYKRYRFTS